eukprot:6400575-Amphidinium_carterae.1
MRVECPASLCNLRCPQYLRCTDLHPTLGLSKEPPSRWLLLMTFMENPCRRLDGCFLNGLLASVQQSLVMRMDPDIRSTQIFINHRRQQAGRGVPDKGRAGSDGVLKHKEGKCRERSASAVPRCPPRLCKYCYKADYVT